MTGTLGSDEAKSFLNKTYNVMLMEIPPFSERRLLIEPGYMMYSQREWLERIIEAIEFKMEQRRSVLVICESIQDVDNL